MNRGSKLSLSRRRRVRARSRGSTDRPSTQIPHSLASSVNCQAFIPPQVDDPLNLAGVNSSLQKMQPSCLPEVICHDLIVSPSLALDMMSKSSSSFQLASPFLYTYDTRRAAERRNSNVRGGGPREVSKVKKTHVSEGEGPTSSPRSKTPRSQTLVAEGEGPHPKVEDFKVHNSSCQGRGSSATSI